MNSVSYDISQLIEYEADSATPMVFATNTFIGREPETQKENTIITLFDTSSTNPSSSFDGSDYLYESIQIRIRSTNYQEAFEMADNLKNWLHNKVPGLINGTLYRLVRILSGPSLLDYDEKDRVRVVMNFQVQRTDDVNIVLMNLGDIEFHTAIDDSADPFPEIGQSNVLYVDKENKTQYLWDSIAEEYVQISGGDASGKLNIDQTVQQEMTGGALSDFWDFDTGYAGDCQEGRIQWDGIDGTLKVGLPGGNVCLQLGQEMLLRAKNDQGTDIENGKLVYISGGTGSQPKFKLADNDSLTEATAIGMTTEAITSSQFGYICTRGLVRNVNTISYTPGTVLWLGEDGGYTSTRPTAPEFNVVIGIVIRQSETEGVIYCQIDIVPRLSGLSDVLLDSISDGQVLAWDAASGTFKNVDNYTTQTITITVADWAGGTTAAKTVTGVTVTSFQDYYISSDTVRSEIISANVRPIAQGVNSITFKADSTPTAEIILDVTIKEVS